MLQKGLPSAAEETGKFRPGIRGASINNSNSLDPWLRRRQQARGLAALHAAPELALGRDYEVLIERIGMGCDLDAFAATGNHRRASESAGVEFIDENGRGSAKTGGTPDGLGGCRRL